MPHHVIIGAGPAGINAIETIRQFDRDSSITLVSDERPYARMALPYFLANEIPEEHLSTASEAYFDNLRVDRRVGSRATRVDTTARVLHLDDGETLSFDTLLVATGSSATRPNIPGAEGKHVHNLWTLNDALAVMDSASIRKPTAVLIGSGFIGLIVLNALHRLGWKLSVVEMESHVLPRMLDRRGAAAAEAWLRARGVGVYTGCTATVIDGARKKTVHLSDGQTLRANVVILCTGIQPNLGFLDGSGVEAGDGIVVDAHMRTSAANVYAAGDVAQGPDLLGGPVAVHAIQATAVDHGRIAGANMAGQVRPYGGSLLMNILDIAGLHCASFGRWREDDDTAVIWNPARPVYRKLVWEGGRLVGGIIAGPVEDTTMLTDVGMLKGLIQSKADLSSWKRYVDQRPWDLRRVYVASGAAAKLMSQTTLGAASAVRGFRFQDRSPRTDPGPHHGALVGTRPPGFESLPRTPTPGIYKAPVESQATEDTD